MCYNILHVNFTQRLYTFELNKQLILLKMCYIILYTASFFFGFL